MLNERLPKRINLRGRKRDTVNIPSFNLNYIPDITGVNKNYYSQTHTRAQSRKTSITANYRTSHSSLHYRTLAFKKPIFKFKKYNNSILSTQETIVILKEMLRRLDKKPLKVDYNQTLPLANISKLSYAPLHNHVQYSRQYHTKSALINKTQTGKVIPMPNLNSTLINKIHHDENIKLTQVRVTRKKRMSGDEESISFDAKKILDQYKEAPTRNQIPTQPHTAFTTPSKAFIKYKRPCISVNYNT